MQKNKRIVIRYSEAFKHQIVKEIEEGGLALEEVRVKYGIKGYSTVQGWIKRIGKLEALPKIVRVETPDEKSRIKELERQVQELKNSLAETQVRYLIAESQFEVICDQQGLDPEEVKKKLSAKPSSKP
jgi:transposase-like protein